MSEASQADTAGPGATELDPKRWGVLAVVVVAQLMVVLDASIVTIALPSAQRALHISVANRQWVITAYTVRSEACFSSGAASPTSGDAGGCSSSGRLALPPPLHWAAWPAIRPCCSGPAPCRVRLRRSWRRRRCRS